MYQLFLSNNLGIAGTDVSGWQQMDSNFSIPSTLTRIGEMQVKQRFSAVSDSMEPSTIIGIYKILAMFRMLYELVFPIHIMGSLNDSLT